MWNKLKKLSFKWKFLIWIISIILIFVLMYSWCGSILKVDCHQIILNR